jgi:hypothetical protein
VFGNHSGYRTGDATETGNFEVLDVGDKDPNQVMDQAMENERVKDKLKDIDMA